MKMPKDGAWEVPPPPSQFETTLREDDLMSASNRPASGASAPEAAPVIQEVDMEEIHRGIKQQMRAVFAARIAYLKLAAIADEAGAKAKEVVAMESPVSLDDGPAEFVAFHEQRLRSYYEADAVHGQRLNESFKLHAPYRDSFVRLKELVAANRHHVPEGDDLLLAAEHLIVQLEKETEPKAPIAVTPAWVDYTDSEIALLRELRALTVRTCELHSQVRKVFYPLKELHDEVSWYRDRKVVRPPARPSEEEIQRYLRQLEESTTERQQKHRKLNQLLAERNRLMPMFSEARTQLRELRARVNSNLTNSLQRQTMSALSTRVDDDSYSDWYYCKDFEVKYVQLEPNYQRKAPTAKEQKYIDKLRKAMRELALNLARMSEAEAALNIAAAAPRAEVDWSGVSKCRSFAECIEWLKQKMAKKREADGTNKIRQTRIDLLQETKTHYEFAVYTAAVNLRRMVILGIPRKQPLPCDELRMLLNAAAIMHKPASGREKSDYRTGDYPVY